MKPFIIMFILEKKHSWCQTCSFYRCMHTFICKRGGGKEIKIKYSSFSLRLSTIFLLKIGMLYNVHCLAFTFTYPCGKTQTLTQSMVKQNSENEARNRCCCLWTLYHLIDCSKFILVHTVSASSASNISKR